MADGVISPISVNMGYFSRPMTEWFLRVRYKAILDEPKGKHECFHLQFSKHLLTFFSYLKYVLTNLTFFCCEYSKKLFAFLRNLDFDNHLRNAQLQKSSHLQKIQKNLKKMYSCLHYQRLLRKFCKDSSLDQVLKFKVTILKQSKIRKSSSLPCVFSINSTYKIQLFSTESE